jgi:hypothetical protein
MPEERERERKREKRERERERERERVPPQGSSQDAELPAGYFQRDRKIFAEVLMTRILPRVLTHLRAKWHRNAHEASDEAIEVVIRLLSWFDRGPELPATGPALVAFALTATDHLVLELNRKKSRDKARHACMQSMEFVPAKDLSDSDDSLISEVLDCLQRIRESRFRRVRPRLRRRLPDIHELIARNRTLPSVAELRTELGVTERTASRVMGDLVGLLVRELQVEGQ